MKNVSFVFMIFVFITLVTGIVYVAFVQKNKQVHRLVFSAPIPAVDTTPTIPPSYNAQVSTMDSPEGSQTLILQQQPSSNGTVYSLYTSPLVDESMQQLFSTEESYSGALLIPYNTWAPDNAYVFLKETKNSSHDYLVFQSSGEAFSEDSPYLSVESLFKDQVSDYVIEDVTGWGGQNLLVVNAKQKDNGAKVSFWFDVPSQSFIRLSTYFK